MLVRTGNRQVLIWGHYEWVTILPGGKADEYRVLPPGGDEFVVEANSDAQCVERIVAELRRRNPQA